MTTLVNTLTKNKFLLGTNYCRLGQATSFGPFRGKIFLSYNGKHGWDVVQLNCVQLFFRHVLGFYRSTRLETIVEGWNRYKVGRIEFNPKKYKTIPALEKRLQELWKKSRGSAELPPFTRIFGNKEVKKAKIFGFGEMHGDKAFRKYTANVIDKYYRDGDIILVEGVASGKTTKAAEHPLTEYIRRSNVKVQGWEPKGFEKRTDALFETTTKMYESMVAKYTSFIEKLPKKKTLTKAQLQDLENKTNLFFKEELTPFYKFFLPDPQVRKKRIQFGELLLQNCFAMLRNKKQLNPAECVALSLEKLACELEKQQAIVCHKHVSTSAAKKTFAYGKTRNDSLCNELNKHARPGRHVFVIGGALHFFKNPLADSTKVVDTMKRHSFVLATTGRVYQHFHLARFQSGYDTRPPL